MVDEREDKPSPAADEGQPRRGTRPDRGRAPDVTPTLAQAPAPELADTHPSPPEHEMPPPGELEVVSRDSYDVQKEFARGGLGRILRAWDRRLGRQVALKELIARSKNLESRFQREAILTARLQHPSIVPVYEAGRWPSGEQFYSMKLVDGRSLSDVIEDAHTLQQRLSLLPAVIDVAEALAYAHSEGIIHRDLKPANVLVGPFGETVVIDWGLAKDLRGRDAAALDDEASDSSEPRRSDPPLHHTGDGIIVGTLQYMPPEQARAQPVDERADVYALGAILYEVLTGLRPYEELPNEDVLTAVRDGPPRKIEELAPHVPAELITIAEKAMARAPEGRYPTAKEMAEELKRFSTGQLVGAHDYTAWEIVRRFVDRNRAAVTTATFAFLVLLAFAGWFFAELTSKNVALEARVNQMILRQATSLLDQDPTAALATLKLISAPVPGAASVAADALDRGVAHYVFHDHLARVEVLRFSPDGRHVASAGADKTIRIRDTQTGATEILAGHEDTVTDVAYSPAGRWLASASYDNVVRLWDLETKKHRTLVGHEDVVRRVLFSPDGDRVVSMGSDHTIRIWPKDGQSPPRTASVQVDRSTSMAFTPDGRLVTASHGGAIEVRSLERGKTSVTRLVGHDGMIHDIAVHPLENRIASAGADGTIRLWDLDRSDDEIVLSHAGPALAVAFSPDGTHLVSGGLDGTIEDLALDSGVVRSLRGHDERVVRIEFAPDGRRFATGSWDKTVRIWEVETGESIPLLGHSDVVSDLGFSVDGSAFASTSWDKSVRIWELEPARRRVLRGHRIGVHTVDFSPDGRFAASGGHDNEVRVWDVSSGESRVLTGHQDHIFEVSYAPNGKWIASSSDDRTVRLWSTTTWESSVLKGHRADVERLEWSGDSRKVASAADDHRVFVWSIANLVGRELEGHSAEITDLSWSARGDALASSSRDGTIRLWPIEGRGGPWFSQTGTTAGDGGRVLEGDGQEVWSIDVSPDSTRLASAGADGALRLWNLVTGTSKRIMRVDVPLKLVRYSEDGRYLVVASSGRPLYLCDLPATRCFELRGHAAMVRDARFDRWGTALVTASGDQTVRVWDLETRENRVFHGHRAPVFSLDISPDGTGIITGGGDADVRLWPLQLPPKPERLSTWLSNMTNEQAPELIALPGDPSRETPAP